MVWTFYQPPSGQDYSSVESTGLVQTRTPGQVLNIVYGWRNQCDGRGILPERSQRKHQHVFGRSGDHKHHQRFCYPNLSDYQPSLRRAGRQRVD